MDKEDIQQNCCRMPHNAIAVKDMLRYLSGNNIFSYFGRDGETVIIFACGAKVPGSIPGLDISGYFGEGHSGVYLT